MHQYQNVAALFKDFVFAFNLLARSRRMCLYYANLKCAGVLLLLWFNNVNFILNESFKHYIRIFGKIFGEENRLNS